MLGRHFNWNFLKAESILSQVYKTCHKRSTSDAYVLYSFAPFGELTK